MRETEQQAAREGVSLFIAGHTPGWGELEFLLDGKVIEGLHLVDTYNRFAIVYARDTFGRWPVFSPAGKALLYKLCGHWVAQPVYPPDIEFEDPDYVERKSLSQQRVAARKKTCGSFDDLRSGGD